MFQCSYTESPFNNLSEYKQDTGKGLIPLIIIIYSATRKSNGGHTATLDQVTIHSSLHITATQLSDSALYLCVVIGLCTCNHYLHLEVVKEAQEKK